MSDLPGYYRLVFDVNYATLGNLKMMSEGTETVEQTAKRLLLGIRLPTTDGGMRNPDARPTKADDDALNHIVEAERLLAALDTLATQQSLGGSALTLDGSVMLAAATSASVHVQIAAWLTR